VSTRSGVFLGRSRELDTLCSLLDRAAAGESRVALVTGEPGIGKTRLLDEVAALAAERGFALGWGRSWELGSAPTLWPWIEALRALLSRPAARDPAAERLLQLLPELETQTPTTAVQEAGPRGDGFALYDAVAGYLRSACARGPVLLVLDDLHAADPSSLELARLVASSMRGSRFALLGSHRDVEARLTPLVDDALSKLARDAEVLLLGRLRLADVEALVRERLNHDEPAAARMIHDSSEGNPLFVHELLRLLVARGQVGAGVPAGVRAVIRERLALLSPATVALLQAAAVVGREFALPIAAEVAGVTAAALEEAALEAGHAELLAPSGGTRMRFSHALVAETLAADLPATVRFKLHRRAAEALQAARGRDPSTASLDEVAHHYRHAGADAADRAAQASERAAEAAYARLAFADAAASYEHALESLRLSASGDVRRHAELLIAQGEAYARGGERARAHVACTTAADAAATLGDGVMLARAALALGAEALVGTSDPPLIRLLERALAALPEGDGAWRARVMARLASARQPEPDPEGPMQLAREAIAMARRSGEDDVLLHVLHSALGALVDYAPPGERAELNQEAARLADAAADRPRGLRARTRLMFDRIELVDIHGFERTLLEYEDLAQETGQPRYLWVAKMFRSMRANWEGRFAEADALETEGRAMYELSRGDGPPCVPGRALARSMLREQVDGMEDAWTELGKTLPNEATLHGTFFAFLQARRGRLEEATSMLSHTPRAELIVDDLHVLHVLTELVWHVRREDLAEALYPLLLRRAGRLCLITGIGYCVHDVVDHALLRLAALTGRHAAADKHAADALALCARIGAAPIAAAVKRDYERALRERGEVATGESPDAVPAPRPSAVVPPSVVTMEQEGEYWTLRGLDQLCRVRDGRGVQMLGQLLAQPGRELHVLELSGALEPVDGGDAGESVDARALAAYRARACELRADLDEATARRDEVRRDALRVELEALETELAGSVGLGGRARRSGSAVERARVNVRRRVALALRHVMKANPALGRHLGQHVRTGTYCAYQP